MNEKHRRPAFAARGAGSLFQVLRDGVPRTRAELAEFSGSARSTIVGRVDELIGAGLVHAAGEAASSGGRPPQRVAFNAAGGAILALDLGATHGTLAVADLAGRIAESLTVPIDIAKGPGPVLAQVLSEAVALLARCSSVSRPLLGVGIGVPGPVEYETGQLTNPPIMPDWGGFDIRAVVRREFDVPVYVDNDVNILAVGERHIAWPHVDDMIFVKVSTGIGAGIIAGGLLQRGARGSAGDIGHVGIPYAGELNPPPATDRDLEAVASGTAIALELRAQGIDVSTIAQVAALVRGGDPLAIEAVRHAGRAVGEVLAGVVNLLNPSTIVLGGSIACAGEHLLAGVREAVYRRSTPSATRDLVIVTAQAGERGGVSGAAMMVAQEILAPDRIDDYVANRRKMASVTPGGLSAV